MTIQDLRGAFFEVFILTPPPPSPPIFMMMSFDMSHSNSGILIQNMTPQRGYIEGTF
jgi:hypothetical protein